MINNSKYIFDSLKLMYPTYKSFLNYSKDYEFLFAVILSAQTTDIKVNLATKKLFSDLPNLSDYNENNSDIILNDIKSLGLYKAKSKYLILTANKLINNFNGKVPSNRADLLTLDGVGYKTSGVVLNQLYKANYLPVDTHIKRISLRLGIVKENNPDKIEERLEKYFDKYDKVYLHHALILLGRNICISYSPKCSQCKLNKVCKYCEAKYV